MKKVIHEVVKLGLVKFADPKNPFKSRSGQSKSYVIDSRGAGSDLKLRRLIIDAMESKLEEFSNPDVIVGIAKSGIVWGSWLAWNKKLPYATVLLEGPRSTGMRRSVEGNVNGKRAIIIDNWCRSGTSIQKAVALVNHEGGQAIGAIVISAAQNVRMEIPVAVVWYEEELLRACSQVGY